MAKFILHLRFYSRKFALEVYVKNNRCRDDSCFEDRCWDNLADKAKSFLEEYDNIRFNKIRSIK